MKQKKSRSLVIFIFQKNVLHIRLPDDDFLVFCYILVKREKRDVMSYKLSPRLIKHLVCQKLQVMQESSNILVTLKMPVS